jgi:putative drug exporter of the RND superfamily
MNTVQIADPPSTRAAKRPNTFERLGTIVAHRPWRVLAVFGILLAVAGFLGSRVFTELQAAGYDDPNSESINAANYLEDNFDLYSPPVAIAIEAPQGLNTPAVEAKALDLQAEISDLKNVTEVASYWSSGRPDQLASKDGRYGQMLVYADNTNAEEQMALARTIQEDFSGTQDGVVVHVGGFGAVSDSITEHVAEDLTKAESIAIPITMILLIVVFGSVVSALLPFSVAMGGIVGSLFVLWGIATNADVSIFAMNLVTGLGLGLGIDYALLIVNRFREELSQGHTPPDAVARTVATAGRTVVVSGLTVAVVLASLLVFPLYFLRSFGYAGIAVTVLAVISSVTALPALLALLGYRVDRLKVVRGSLAPKDQGMWSRVARFVMRWPIPVLLVTVTALGALAAPFLNVEFTQTDSRVLPADDPAAKASRILNDEFVGEEATPINVVLPGAASDTSALDSYAQEVSKLDDIVRVTTPESVVVDGEIVGPNPAPANFTTGDDARVSAISSRDPLRSGAQEQIRQIRAIDAPSEESLVGGTAAAFTDAQTAIREQGRWALLWVAVATLVVLFLYTGSVLLPVKAIVLNVLSLSATMGLLVLVFQEGYLTWLTGDFTVTGGIDTSMAVLIAITTFALSMDYEVFLLSRIKEEHDAGRNTTESLAFGLQRSGRIITAAALLLAIVFGAFVTSGVTSIKQLGLGVAFAILLDATVVRGLLVPALMKTLGEWNWWAPKPLRNFHSRFGLSDA